MAESANIIYDEGGHPRHFRFQKGEAALTGASPQDAARSFLESNADTLKVPSDALRTLDVRTALSPTGEAAQLRFESEKRQMDSTTVSYVQTMFGLPIYQAGVSVTTHQPDNAIAAATSTLHYDIEAAPPADALKPAMGLTAATGSYDEVVRKAIPNAKGMRINHTSLLVYRYDATKRISDHVETGPEAAWGPEPPTLPLAEPPASIKDGTHYVVVEALFTLPMPDYGPLNWKAFIEPDSGAVLYLRALVDGVTGLVFDRDPITKTGNLADLPNAAGAVLDALRDNVALADLVPPVSGHQALTGSFVQLFDVSAPTVASPTTVLPFNFAFASRTNDFAATNAYYHCDRFFRFVRDQGFNIPTYFDGTAFPVHVDHRALGNVINAQCQGNALSNGIGAVVFALADTGDTTNPIGISADWRVVLHELGGHGILWDHVNSPNFGFAHSAGDSFAVILNDVDTHAPDRFVSFPWVNIGRRHDRPVNGWGFGGANDVGGYSTEQILATTHFRLYRSIGGDSAYPDRRQFAARAATYLILRAVGQLTPATNPTNPLGWEQHLETADAGTWISTNPAETNAGGAYHKVIRWAFEKQGLFRAPGAPATVEGVAPPVDVYIDDGRAGEYPFLANHWSCTDIWNRRTIGAGGGVHEEPVVGQTNYAYVRIKNRGAQAATNVVVKGFHALPGVGLIYPADWFPMTTPQLAAPNVAAHDAVGEVVGPFHWIPAEVGHECMFFSVSANGDPSNIDGAITGAIPEWRLVPNDNNIAQRNVHPVSSALGEAFKNLPFWIRNHSRRPVKLAVDVKLPEWLGKLGWKVDVPQIGREQPLGKPGELLKVFVEASGGKPVTDAILAHERDHDIVLTVLQDNVPVGGMTFRITGHRKIKPEPKG
ncbi:MAG TPA: hypothetical protein VF459_05225 [Caulobacteraceae bacterium]